jgi:hypothetical protein
VSGFPEVLGEINRLAGEIEELTSERAHLTDQLEQLAGTWDKRYPQPMMTPGHQHRLVCSRCYFRYMDTTETEVRFGTDCTWCGRDAGMGVQIPVTWFERQLQEEPIS